MKIKKREMAHRSGVFEVKCPTCKGKGKHLGQVPYPHCIRCAGFRTILLIDPDERRTDVQ